jgi:hypothetical protein
MVQLPVFRTYGNALGFTLWNAFTIFRLTWLPTVLLAFVVMLPSFFLDTDLSRALYGLDEHENLLTLGLGFQLALNLLQAIAMTSVAVAVHRVILFNDRRPGHYFVFAFGATEFAFLVMGILSVLIVVGVMGTILGPMIYVLANGDFAAFFDRFKDWPKNVPELVGSLAPLIAGYVAGWLIVLFVFVRLAVWPPSVVATNSVSPAQAWSLTRGNFWRFVGLFVLAGLTMYAVVIPVAAVFYLNMREYAFSREIWEATRDLPVRDALWRELGPFIPTLAVLYFFMLMYATAFLVAIISFAYKALKGIEAGATIDGG